MRERESSCHVGRWFTLFVALVSEKLVRWIVDPLAVDPHTAMPNLHVSEADARDIAGYFHTLK